MNVKLGKYNQLKVVKEVDFGVYLDGDDDGEILLPARYVPDGCKPDDVLNVFIYLDNEERLIATTLQPLVQVGEFACLEVAWVNEFGAFLNWGLMKKGSSQVTIPLGTVLTIPATGSEMNNGAVISRRETHEKYPFYADYPVFSILDPTVTFSLPDFQIACGLADTFVHVMEQYMTKSNESYLMDRWSESILRTLVQIAPLIKENKQDYHLMSEFMMSATMALNGFIAMGVSQDWATHMIGHELTALHGMTHGQTLAIVFPGTLRTLADKKRDKILQYGERIWGVTSGVPSARIALTIDKTEEFFKSLGLKTRLGEAGIGDDTIEEIARRFDERGAAFGEDGDVTGEVARRILQNCK